MPFNVSQIMNGSSPDLESSYTLASSDKIGLCVWATTCIGGVTIGGNMVTLLNMYSTWATQIVMQ